MKLTEEEVRFLTSLAREHNQTGCRGPAHELLRESAYPEAPRNGPGSLAFSYDAEPLTAILLLDFTDLREVDAFLRKGELATQVAWPWSSAEAYRTRLEEARQVWRTRSDSGLSSYFNGKEVKAAAPLSGSAGAVG
jgi:hypothetical protein